MFYADKGEVLDGICFPNVCYFLHMGQLGKRELIVTYVMKVNTFYLLWFSSVISTGSNFEYLHNFVNRYYET